MEVSGSFPLSLLYFLLKHCIFACNFSSYNLVLSLGFSFHFSAQISPQIQNSNMTDFGYDSKDQQFASKLIDPQDGSNIITLVWEALPFSFFGTAEIQNYDIYHLTFSHLADVGLGISQPELRK